MSNVRWIDIDKEDSKAESGDYFLRVERMDKTSWWWAVYFNSTEIAMDSTFEIFCSTENEAKIAAETCMVSHKYFTI